MDYQISFLQGLLIDKICLLNIFFSPSLFRYIPIILQFKIFFKKIIFIFLTLQIFFFSEILKHICI
jgi:hypothetical protein